MDDYYGEAHKLDRRKYTDGAVLGWYGGAEALPIGDRLEEPLVEIENAERLKQTGADVTFRMPYIPGFNDGELAAVKAFVGDFPLQLMPYHATGEGKYAALGRPYPAAGTAAPERTTMEALARQYGAIYEA